MQELAVVLRDAIREAGATKGNMQVVRRATQELELVLQHGFDEAFTRTFATVSWDDGTACGRAFRTGARIVIPDITLDPIYAPYVEISRASGYLAVQSTPMLDASGQVIGVLSTHFPQPQALSREAARRIDALACRAAERIGERLA
jgi:GAF domain-containing protein